MQVTAEMVKTLRERTGLPMMDCKKALSESGGDESAAIEWLRARGLKAQTRMGDREASEGRVAVYVDAAAGCAGIVELRCETAPVANTDDFIGLARRIAQQKAVNPAATPETVRGDQSVNDPSRTLGDDIDQVFNRIRENIRIARLASLQGNVGHYTHHNGQVAVLVEMSEACPPEASADVCMHIAALRPQCVRRDEVDAAEVQRQRAEFAQEAEGKPTPVVEKIVAGKLGRWFSEFVLLDQPFAKDDKISVAQYLDGVMKGLSVKRFIRFQVGGG